MSRLDQLRVKLFADVASTPLIVELRSHRRIRGFTTNPTLMRASGVSDYEAFARDVLHAVADRPVCFEVFADEFEDMEWQAREIASWGPNVYVKIPITNTRRESARRVIARLSGSGVKLNVTAVLTLDQVCDVATALTDNVPSFVSVFAGRIADTGRDPVPIVAAAVDVLRQRPNVELIWASSRELLNIFQADSAGCHIITVTPEILKKLPLIDKDLSELSLETVQMFYRDAQHSGFALTRHEPSHV